MRDDDPRSDPRVRGKLDEIHAALKAALRAPRVPYPEAQSEFNELLEAELNRKLESDERSRCPGCNGLEDCESWCLELAKASQESHERERREVAERVLGRVMLAFGGVLRGTAVTGVARGSRVWNAMIQALLAGDEIP